MDITHVADGPKANIAVLQGGVSALLGYFDICDLPLNFHPVTIKALTDVSLIGSCMIGWKGFDRMATNRWAKDLMSQSEKPSLEPDIIPQSEPRREAGHGAPRRRSPSTPAARSTFT